ncbi:FACT complex subunit spt16 [Serendipita sp. 401]|nr:FACT complex subunit spt16 [Serendipita sp. 401]
MAPVELDTVHYNVRMSIIYDAWSSASDFEEYNSMSNLDALLLISGEHSEDDVPRKTSAVQTWLLGYEFPSTFILMQKNRVTFLCSSSKAKILEPIRASSPRIPVEILALPKAKDATANTQEIMNNFIALFTNVQRVGTLTKEEQSGKAISDYKAALQAAGHNFEGIDISVALGAAMAIKDEEELKIIRTTSNLCNTLVASYILPKLETIIDKEKPTSHAALVSLVEHRLGDNERAADMKLWSKGRNLTDVDFASVEFVYVPQIQSAASGYNLKLVNEPSSAEISFKGVLITSVGLKYKDVARESKDCLFFFQQDNEEKPKPKSAPKPASPAKKIAGGKALRTATRSGGGAENVQTVRTKNYPHQVELHAKRQSEGLARYESGGGGGGGAERKTWKRFVSYKGDAALPTEISEPKIYIDKKALTVVLPINGYAVPFHINTIKNASKNDEAEYVYLRINLQTPGQLTGKKEDTPFEDPDATFIRSLTYRSLNRMRFDNLFTSIQQLKKDVNKKEQQKKELADVVEQDKLEELKGRRPHKLPDVFPRPALDGKRLPGDVEIHQNGLRYTSMANQRVDVLFSNIKHLFFQPCDNELVVIIHCHLRSPIMIGKKKTKDVQFYREATDMQFDETGNRKRKHRYGDEDEIEMEQAERKRRTQLNKEFKAFAEKISEAATDSNGEPLELDIPYTELAFEGVPFRTNVKLAPTMDCLVYLTDPPFLVATLAEIEIASLERVQFGLKHFDLVFVFHDLTRQPLSINSIPSSQLNNVMEWLNDVDVPVAESQINLNWGPIMKTINDDPAEFFAGGGWGFLTIPGAPAGGDSSASEEESSYDESSDGASSSEPSESDFDGDDASDDDDMSGMDDSGEDWEEMEEKAAKSDKKKADKRGGGGGGSDSDVPKKKKPAAAGKSKR